MDLNEIAMFVHVVREGGVAPAARALDVPKSTVSRSIARLEERLGVRLLLRGARQVTPTLEGAQLYERCARVITEAEEAVRFLGQSASEPCGALRLTAGRPFEPFLAPVVSRYATQFPGVRVDILLSDRYVDVVEEGFDLAIRGGRRPDGGALTARQFSTVARVFCASPDYVRQRGAPKTPEALAAHACITTGESAGEQEWAAGDEGRPVIVRVRGQIHATTVGLARELAVRGHGVALLPTWIVAEDLRARRLRVLLKDACPPPLKLWLLTPSARHTPARVRAFVELLVEHARRSPGWKTELAPAALDEVA